jgi:Holliday junction resolvase RusA-like endonuclease
MQDLVDKLVTIFDNDNSEVKNTINSIIQNLALQEKDLKNALKFVHKNENENNFKELNFTIFGNPPIAKRPRARIVNNLVRIFAADRKDKDELANEIRLQIPEDHILFCGEVELFITIYRPFLACWAPYKQFLAELGYIRPDRKPDYDNYAKIITDAMLKSVFYDDNLVVIGNVSIYYSTQPRLEIKVLGRETTISK